LSDKDLFFFHQSIIRHSVEKLLSKKFFDTNFVQKWGVEIPLFKKIMYSR